MLIVLQQLGDTICTLEFQTHNYLITSLRFSLANTGVFEHTSNLRKTAKDAGILKWASIPEHPGFVLIFKVTIVNAGQSMLALTITDSNTDTLYFEWFYEHYSLIDEEVTCFANISLGSW